MPTIQELDPNFREKELQGGFRYQDARSYAPVVFEGLYPGVYCRIDPAYLPSIRSTNIRDAALLTAGGALRFRVPGGKFAIRYTLHYGGDMSHMARSGVAGIDVYYGSGFHRTFRDCVRPMTAGGKEACGEFQLPPGEEEVLLNLPLYDGIDTLELGFPDGVYPQAPSPHHIAKPVLFYGSSITQGGCASRPGTAYTALVGRALDCPVWNLGFSGNAKGDPEMAEYIAAQSLSAFVMDYDHNANTAEDLERTHLPFLRIILEKQPELPVLMISRPDYFNVFTTPEDILRRRNIIFRSYQWALDHGYHVQFLDGSMLFEGNADCTVDGCHPTDLGFFRMAEHIIPALRRFFPNLAD
jgi:hypothetical protein